MKSLINRNRNLLLVLGMVLNIIYVLVFKPPCPWKSHFDIDCAGCGGTRMLQAILKLDFYQAFRFNPFIFLLLVLIFCYMIYIFLRKYNGKSYYKLKNRDYLILLSLTILFMIIRNIPIFNYLKPTVIR